MTRGLRIGVDGEALRRPLSGVGRYTFELARALVAVLPDAEFVAYSRLPADALALPSDAWTLRREPHAAWRQLPSFAWLKTRAAALARDDALDLFWAPRTLHPRLRAPLRTVATVHDLNHLIVPETMPWPTRLLHRVWFSGDLECADAVIANSVGTAARLHAMLGVRALAIVPPGVDARFRGCGADDRVATLAALRRLGVRPPYLLSVATLEPRKNVGLVLRAFVDLKRRGELPDVQLVLAGAGGWRHGALAQALRGSELDGVVVPGFVDEALLPALYAHARALVCPSRYEGFGMPVLEARACGTRVIVSDTPELRESGGPHAVLVAPNLEAWRQALRRSAQLEHIAEPALVELHGWHRRAATFAALLRALAVRETFDARAHALRTVRAARQR